MFAHATSKERLGYAALATVLLLFAGYVGARHLKRPATIAVEQVAPAQGSVAVDVAGAVAKPGVVRLPSGARVQAAIDRAGGPTDQADLARLNLAAPLVDGSQLVVPTKNDQSTKVADRYGGGTSSAYEKVEETLPASTSNGAGVSLSLASAKELESVPGIGPATASRIVEYRASHGGFRSVDELMAVKGIGPKKLEQMRPYLKP
ncbi:MAG: helix-hairpin-helix domain-containing protein [Chthonomonadaceae bacterium]|nr:helix-hairpin-helix domain-containing protein [Chthonomonadaceae bacterium]